MSSLSLYCVCLAFFGTGYWPGRLPYTLDGGLPAWARVVQAAVAVLFCWWAVRTHRREIREATGLPGR